MPTVGLATTGILVCPAAKSAPKSYGRSLCPRGRSGSSGDNIFPDLDEHSCPWGRTRQRISNLGVALLKYSLNSLTPPFAHSRERIAGTQHIGQQAAGAILILIETIGLAPLLGLTARLASRRELTRPKGTAARTAMPSMAAPW